MTHDLEQKLRLLRSRFIAEGFNIIGVSGSYARDEETSKSDLDLLYEIPDPEDFAAR